MHAEHCKVCCDGHIELEVSASEGNCHALGQCTLVLRLSLWNMAVTSPEADSMRSRGLVC